MFKTAASAGSATSALYANRTGPPSGRPGARRRGPDERLATAGAQTLPARYPDLDFEDVLLADGYDDAFLGVCRRNYQRMVVQDERRALASMR